MTKQITIREALTEQETEFFWEQLHAYHARDIFPDPGDEDLDYFLDDSQYRDQIEKLRNREKDPVHYLLFSREGQDMGFAMAAVFNSEDGKCFLMEFCVLPEFRGGGTGSVCAGAFLDWAKSMGSRYAELNCNGEQRKRFWSRQGFVPNGVDEWGVPLMLLPPEEEENISVEILCDPEDWQLMKLECGFLAEIGEDALSDDKKERLSKAVEQGRIIFFLAKRGYRAVGMCSVSPCFSTFCCGNTGVFDDFYIEPVFRRQGVARKLAEAAQNWCVQNDIESLTVCCAPCDEEMYKALGFSEPLGRTFAHLS